MKAGETAMLKTYDGSVRVTILEAYCDLNWRVRISEGPCVVKGHKLAAGSTYIAGESQLVRSKK